MLTLEHPCSAHPGLPCRDKRQLYRTSPSPAPSQCSGGSSTWAETFSTRNTALSRAVREKTALVLAAATQYYLIPLLLHCRVTAVVLWCAKITMLPSSGLLAWPAG